MWSPDHSRQANERPRAVSGTSSGETRAPLHLETAGFGVGGMHGGYVLAQVVRSLFAQVADPLFEPLSLQVHFASPARPGEAKITVLPERSGRSIVALSFRLTQRHTLVALGVGSFAKPRPGTVSYNDYPMPTVPPPELCQQATREELGLAPWADAFDMRPCIGGQAFSGSAQAISGGWIRPLDGRPLDAAVVAGLLDSWLPSVRTRLTAPNNYQPTIDLSVQFRSRSPRSAATPADYCLIQVSSRLAAGGFWEEDGVLWSRDGEVLAQSRQLAIIA